MSTAQKRGPGSVPRSSSQSCREGRAEAGNETGRGLRPLPRRTRMAARRSFGSSLHRLNDSHPYAPDCSRQILSRDLEAFVQAIQSKRTVQDLIGVL